MTSHQHKQKVAQKFYRMQIYEFVQVFYDIKWISSGAFEFEKKPNKQP